MNIKTFFAMASICLSGVVSFAEPVPIRWEPPEGNEWVEIPVTADYDESTGELALKFAEDAVYFVTVYGDIGLVFSATVTVDNYEEVRINVSSYSGNEAYTIVITDDAGNRYEGDFFG